LNKKGQLTATASQAQPWRPEILRLATATAFYGGGGNFLRLATAYELYGGLRRRLGGLKGSNSASRCMYLWQRCHEVRMWIQQCSNEGFWQIRNSTNVLSALLSNANSCKNPCSMT